MMMILILLVKHAIKLTFRWKLLVSAKLKLQPINKYVDSSVLSLIHLPHCRSLPVS